MNVKTEDAKKTVCPIGREDLLFSCAANECQWWRGDEKEGRCAIPALLDVLSALAVLVEHPLQKGTNPCLDED